jgi:hypothetical protein
MIQIWLNLQSFGTSIYCRMKLCIVLRKLMQTYSFAGLGVAVEHYSIKKYQFYRFFSRKGHSGLDTWPRDQNPI